GAGRNGCILLYRDNNARSRDGELVLIDAGAEYRGYASDITRTFPVNGRFSAEQRALHDLVGEDRDAEAGHLLEGARFGVHELGRLMRIRRCQPVGLR
ncbi:M24 family metallopeptidase, partial [Microvirga antarctica]|uniref:M24 family metallopeptidase n=1 Tax=Microvirga antarctica TaxID=2819233 RepID=UPI001B304E91